MLTYETLRNMAREERESATKMINLPEDFFQEAKVYLDKKAKFAGGKEDAWELESSRRELDALMKIRENKILMSTISYVRSGIEPGDMTREEREFFDRVVENIKAFQNKRKEIFESF